MLEVHHSGHYFLCDPDELEKNDVDNMMYHGLWVMETHVKVTRQEINVEGDKCLSAIFTIE
jgi:hypothetical protein